MRQLLIAVSAAAALICLPAVAAPAPEKPDLIGYAYDLKSGDFLYSEHHAFVYEGDKLVADSVEYRRADGTLFGTKSLDFRANLFVPTYRTEFPELGYAEGLRRTADGIELFRRKTADDEEKTKGIRDLRSAAADAGFHPYVQANFDALMSGDKVKFDFITADYLTSVKFKAFRIEDGEFEGKPVARFKVKIASFIGLFVDPLLVSYDPQTLHLVEYQGISNVKDAKGESYDTRIIYPSSPPKITP